MKCKVVNIFIISGKKSEIVSVLPVHVCRYYMYVIIELSCWSRICHTQCDRKLLVKLYVICNTVFIQIVTVATINFSLFEVKLLFKGGYY